MEVVIGKEVKINDALCVIIKVLEGGDIEVRAKYGGYKIEVEPKCLQYWLQKMNTATASH